MKILADQQIPFAAQAFKQFGEVELVHGRSICNQRLQDVDILLVRSITQVNSELLYNTPVQFVGTATSGFDHIDQDYLQNQAIAYAYAPGSNAHSVAEYVLSALFVLYEQDISQSLESRVAIIGYGHVGSTVAHFLQALGIDCLLNDPLLEESEQTQQFVSLDDALQADIISLHVPLTKQGPYKTEYLIDRPELEMLGNDTVLINTARGGVVNETALLEAIQKKSLKTVIDVWQYEPAINHQLLELADIATAHIAGYSMDGKLRATEMLYRCACNVFDQEMDWDCTQMLSPAKDTLDLTETVDHPLAAVKLLVHGCYDVRQDDCLLKKSLQLPGSDRAEYFDNLRRQYRPRYEFNHTHYQWPDDNVTTDKVLQNLGFAKKEFTCA